jgi:hypothetical protein
MGHCRRFKSADEDRKSPNQDGPFLFFEGQQWRHSCPKTPIGTVAMVSSMKEQQWSASMRVAAAAAARARGKYKSLLIIIQTID